jgi:diguanylate cyclase (GGDEF)-like protein
MPDRDQFDEASSALARRALLVTLSLAFVGAAAGLIAAHLGIVAGAELVLVVCSLGFSSGALVTLLFFPQVALQRVAMFSTSFLTLNIGVGMILAVCPGGQVINLFVYLIWLFPVLVFNRLVNEPTIARLLAKILLIGPMVLIACLAPRLRIVLQPEQRLVLSVYCISFICFALTLNLVTRYRERYIVEREQMEALKVATEVLESISDCFISIDFKFRLIYLNDAACTEFRVDRQTALLQTLAAAAPGFFSESMLAGLRAAAVKPGASIFEAQTEAGISADQRWYDLRCFPRTDGMSVYFRDITKRKANAARIEYLAFNDVLTELPNRQFFRDRLAKSLAATATKATIGALLYIDLDDFKTLNETMGHDTGDALLRQVASRLSSCVGPNDIVARVGGDEFVVMLEGLGPHPQESAAMAKAAGDKLLECFRKPFAMGSYESETTASIGATLFSGALDTVDILLKRTDLAMYEAKAGGRNRMRFFDASMQTAVEERSALRADLRRALQNGELELHYQPQVDNDVAVTGAEALLRWLHPRRGRVSPDEFIPLAEEAGLIVELGQWVLETACAQLAWWSANPAMQALTVAVNVSVRQFLDPQFVSLVRETLRVSGANPQRLKLEITESFLMEQVEEMIAKMRELKILGVGFSLDDFGTGFSSLSHLRHLPLDQLKIDRTFVNNVLTDARDATIARTIIVLGRSLGLSVIAEGVETEAQRDFLKAEGCELYQGFLYSPAVAAAEFEAFVAASDLRNAGT